MPEPGRPAASSGNAYHDVTTAMRLVEMLRDSGIESVRPEAIRTVDDIEVLATGRPAHYEQVKERSPGRSWTAASLHSEGVIRQFVAQHRADQAAELVLVTGSDARELAELATRARSAVNSSPGNELAALSEWRKRLSTELRTFVSDLRGAYPGGLSERRLMRVLAHVKVEDNQGTLTQRRAQLRNTLTGLVADVSKGALALESCARDATVARDRIFPAHVRRALEDGGARPQVATWAIRVDRAQYAETIEREATSLDVAQLPAFSAGLALSGAAINADDLPARVVIVGTHGAGKSRLASELSTRWLRNGRNGLLVRLNRWATDFDAMLETEVAVAAGSRRHAGALREYLKSSQSFLVIDSLDEVPHADRDRAIRQMVEFARQEPQTQIVAMSRPGPIATAPGWPTAELLPLRTDEVDSVLGPNATSDQVRALAGNPLMLGLLSETVDAGHSIGPDELSIINEYVALLVRRDSGRPGAIDLATGIRMAHEAAYHWLEIDALALDAAGYRGLSAEVSRRLESIDRIRLDALSIERWLSEVGLVVNVRDTVVPVHRTVFDQIAAQRIAVAGVDPAMTSVTLREARARYVAGLLTLTDTARSILDSSRGDLEFLARVTSLTTRTDQAADPNVFSRDYLGALRAIETTALPGVPILPTAVRIQVDAELTWIAELAAPESEGDSTEVVENSGRMYLITPDGHAEPAVSRFTHYGYEGRSIGARMPDIAAYERLRDGLADVLKGERLRDEGADITYERLGIFVRQIDRASVMAGGRPRIGLGEWDASAYTAHRLKAWFAELARPAFDHDPSDGDLTETLIVFERDGYVVLRSAEPAAEAPRDPTGLRRGSVIHGDPLVRLVRDAKRLGIADLPIHPLGLLPTDENDAVLSLPEQTHALSGEGLLLYVERAEIAHQRAMIHLVARNLPALADGLSEFRNLPRRLELWVDDRSTPTMVDWTVYRVVDEPADKPIVRTFAGRPESTAFIGWSSGMSYRGIADGVYRDLARDVARLMSGSRALGRDDL
jgi:hypothetical protein